MSTTIIGFPRLGEFRELKFTTEKYFRNEITADELLTAAKDLRAKHWNIVKEKGKNLMKHIYLNLKRFDVPTEFGGVNRIAPVAEWAEYIVKNTQDELKKYDRSEVEFAMYFPEIHLLNAAKAKTEDSPIKVGCQSVYRADTAVGGNFGAFTTNRPVKQVLR